MAKKRSAEASIKGYNYQFIHSIIDLFKQKDLTPVTIEGIEDLDINEIDYTELYQYKYHELVNYKNSLVSKPIGLMFNHFLKNETSPITYKLFIYLNSELPELNETLLSIILKLKTATDHVDEKLIKFCSDKDKIKEFLNNFKWEKTKKYEEIEETIAKVLSETFSVSDDEAKMLFLPNAIQKIIELGMKKDVKDRIITLKELKNVLNFRKNIYDIAYIQRVYGEEKALQEIKKQKKKLFIRKNNKEQIVYISQTNRNNIAELIIDIAKQFFYRGNKNDVKPVTFILENTLQIKKEIFDYLNDNNEVLIMNDGYEDYCFNAHIFNRDCITTNKPLNSKVNDVNFNFKLISKSTYINEEKKIHFSCPVLFCLSNEQPEFCKNFSMFFMINKLSNESITSILGGE